MTGMCPYERNDEDISVRTDVYYEQQASHEEIYLEEREEEVLMILEYEVPPPRESLDQERIEAAEALITGDSDDPSLSAGTVEEMLNEDSSRV
jgi:hypothetical protein